jgi:hypothetical protein
MLKIRLAYYLAGYALECGLKACIAKLMNPDDFPRERAAKDWQETSRYEQETQAKAETLYDAITNNPDGVLPSLRLRW